MKRIVLSFALLATLAAGAALAADATTTATQPAEKGGFDPDQVICKEVASTGSHLPGERVCATWAQWRQASDHDSEMMTEASERPGAPSTGAVGPVTGTSPAPTGPMRR